MKPKICLVCDIPNWALESIAKVVKKSLSGTFDIDIDYFDLRVVGDEFFEFLEAHKDYDLIHFLWRKGLLQFENPVFHEKASKVYPDVEKYIQEMSKKISTCVYDYFFLEPEELPIYQNIFNRYSSHYYVCTEELFQKYSAIESYRKPETTIFDVCDWEAYRPANLERFDKTDRPLVVGWVGNSLRKINDVDLKGFHTIIKPAIQELKAEGYNIEEHYADKNEKQRTQEEMPQYYSEIDVCICASIHEGTPRPVMEGMSCGVPMISTDVGIVRNAFGKKQSEFIIGSRQNGKNDEAVKQALKEKLIELCNHKELLKELSEENQKSIVEYDGGKLPAQFKEYFLKCLNQ